MIVLASQSPRRQALLRQAGILSFRVLPAPLEEQPDVSLPPEQLVRQLAEQKAASVFPLVEPGDLIIAADTIVVQNGGVLGKPKDEAEAARMLNALSGTWHTVYTGLCLLCGTQCVTDVQQAAVCFRSLSEPEITAYLQSGEPMDKAGAYGIQGLGALFVSKIKGDFYTVMGLPLCRLAQLLPQFGISLLPLEGGIRP